MIKVAMIVRSTLYKVRGGDTVQVVETAKHLREIGVEVDIKLTDEKIIYQQYDLLHFFNIIRPADIIYHIKKSEKPFVLSPILLDYTEFDKHHRKGLSGRLFHFLPTGKIEYIKTVSRWILGRDRLMSVSYLWKGQNKCMQQILNQTPVLLPNSMSEYNRLLQRFHFTGNCMPVVNGIDCKFYQNDPLVEKDPCLVICVGRIEGNKNQLNLIKALNNTLYKLWIIGAPAPNQLGYYQECRNTAAENIIFMGPVTQQRLKECYQQAKVHALPSWFETTGLSSLEAGAMGCQLVITDKGDPRDYFKNHAFYCDPSSPESILEAVTKAVEKSSSIELQQKILNNYTWHQAALQTRAAYQKLQSY